MSDSVSRLRLIRAKSVEIYVYPSPNDKLVELYIYGNDGKVRIVTLTASQIINN